MSSWMPISGPWKAATSRLVWQKKTIYRQLLTRSAIQKVAVDLRWLTRISWEERAGPSAHILILIKLSIKTRTILQTPNLTNKLQKLLLMLSRQELAGVQSKTKLVKNLIQKLTSTQARNWLTGPSIQLSQSIKTCNGNRKRSWVKVISVLESHQICMELPINQVFTQWDQTSLHRMKGERLLPSTERQTSSLRMALKPHQNKPSKQALSHTRVRMIRVKSRIWSKVWEKKTSLLETRPPCMPGQVTLLARLPPELIPELFHGLLKRPITLLVVTKMLSHRITRRDTTRLRDLLMTGTILEVQQEMKQSGTSWKILSPRWKLKPTDASTQPHLWRVNSMMFPSKVETLTQALIQWPPHSSQVPISRLDMEVSPAVPSRRPNSTKSSWIPTTRLSFHQKE